MKWQRARPADDIREITRTQRARGDRVGREDVQYNYRYYILDANHLVEAHVDTDGRIVYQTRAEYLVGRHPVQQ